MRFDDAFIAFVVAARLLIVLESEFYPGVWLEILLSLAFMPLGIILLREALTRLTPLTRVGGALLNLAALAAIGLVLALINLGMDYWLAGEEFYSLGAYLLGSFLIVLMVYLGKTQVEQITETYRRLRMEEATLRARVFQLRTEAGRLVEGIAAEMRQSTYQAFKVHFDAIQRLANLKIPQDVISHLTSVRDGSLKVLARNLLAEFGDWEDRLMPVKVRNPLLLPRRFNLGQSIRPGLVLLLIPILIIGRILTNGPTVLTAVAIFAVTQYLGWLVAARMLRNLLLNTVLGVVALTVLTFLIPLLACLPEIPLPGVAESPAAFTVYYFANLRLSPLLMLAIAYYSNIRFSLQRSKSALARLEPQLVRQRSLISQAIQVRRRQFSYFLHGSVQSALNAAVLRLQALDYTDEAWGRFKTDIAEAEVLLSEYREVEIDLWSQIDALKSLWGGIAELQITCTDEAKAAVAQSQTLAFGLNEIWREAIGNAIRHGGATAVAVHHRLDAGTLLLTARNNGAPPTIGAQASLGSALLDDLAYEWWLETDESNDMPVCLTVRLVLDVETGQAQ